MPRYFTVAEAERLLPEVERLLRDALFQKAECQSAGVEFNAKIERIRLAGGSRVDHTAILSLRARRDTAAAALQNALEVLGEMGVQVKDLDIGLIDFLTQYRDREVCLCWKLGEDSIAYWHGLEEGFRGRKAIDAEFIANHRGEPTQ